MKSAMFLMVIKRFVEVLPKCKNDRLFFDNWFCTAVLCVVLKTIDILGKIE